MKRFFLFQVSLLAAAALPAFGQQLPTLKVAPPPSLTHGIQFQQTLSGSAPGNISGSYFNLTDRSAGGSNGIIIGWNYDIVAGGPEVQGSHFGMNLSYRFDQPDNGVTPNPYYVTHGPSMTVMSGNKGRDTTERGARGAYMVENPVARATNAQNLYELTASEMNVACSITCSTYYKSILGLVALSDDKTQGSAVDASLVISAQPGAVGMKNIIDVGGANGAEPFNPDSTIFRAGTSGTAKNLIDGSLTTFTGSLLKGKHTDLSERGLTLGDAGGTTIVSAAGGPSSAATLVFRPGGAESVALQNNGTGKPFARFDQGGKAPANYPVFKASEAKGGDVVYGAAGSDKDINLSLTPKGSGLVAVKNPESFINDPSRCGNLPGSTGCLKILDNAGATRLMPLF
jgi:hypothetical protein